MASCVPNRTHLFTLLPFYAPFGVKDSGEVSKLPVQPHVLKHLEETAFELLAADVQLYEKGACVCVYVYSWLDTKAFSL